MGEAIPRIVVAEDDEEMRRLISTTLRKDGFEVTEVANGLQLLLRAVARNEDPERAFDLIISDLRMPVSSGLQILRGLRTSGWRGPFVLCTAFGDEATRRETERLGALYLDKPFDLDEFRALVHGVLVLNANSGG
jgi:DNA-binding response OmpR family regulator